MTSALDPAIPRMRCPSCGAQMNPHAEKPVAPQTREDLSAADASGSLVEEIHQCPACGQVASRLATGAPDAPA